MEPAVGILNVRRLRSTIACPIRRCIALAFSPRARVYTARITNGSRPVGNEIRLAHARRHGRVSREWCHVTGGRACDLHSDGSRSPQIVFYRVVSTARVLRRRPFVGTRTVRSGSLPSSPGCNALALKHGRRDVLVRGSRQALNFSHIYN